MEWGEYLAQSSAKDRDGAVLLGWTGDNGDPDNFLGVLLGCDARRRQQPRAVVLPGLRGPDPGGQDHLRRRTSARRSTSRRRWSSRSRRPGRPSPTRSSRCRCARTSPASCRTRSASTASTASTRPSSAARTAAGRRRRRAPVRRPPAGGRNAPLHPAPPAPDRADLHRHHAGRVPLHPPAAGRPGAR